MPIPLPNLDDRRWTDLVDEGRTSIPRFAPTWTDHNLHDPGITLIDLFAWLTEMTVFGLNRVTARHKRKFLALVNSLPHDPLAAHVMLGFTPPVVAPTVLVPAGTECEGVDVDRTVVMFRTRRDVQVSPISLSALQVDPGDGVLVDRTRDLRDRLPIAPFGTNPAAGTACYLGFGLIATGVPVTLGFQFAGPGNDEQERQRIIDEAAAQALACQPIVTRLTCNPPASPPTPDDLPPHHSARLVWEAFTTTGWVALATVFDDTRAFTLDGIVELTLPADVTPTAIGAVADALFYVRARLVAGALDAAPSLLDLTLNAVIADQAVPVTETFVIDEHVTPTGTAPTAGALTRLTMTVDSHKVITALDFSATTGPELRVWAYTPPSLPSTKGSLTLESRLIGFGTGRPDQEVTLRDAPVIGDSVRLYTLAGTGPTLAWREWTRRNDFDAASRTDGVFVLDPTTGGVTFGSGERGRMPEPDALIFASYLTTRADHGNAGPGIVTRLRAASASPPNAAWLATLPTATQALVTDSSKFAITQHLAAADGDAAETLDHAIGRAVETLHAHERLIDVATEQRVDTLDSVPRATVQKLRAPTKAVNLLDLERVALATPGTRIARARAWPSLHPTYPCLDAPGIVSLVIVPEAPPDRPMPTDGLLTAVWRYLDRRRMVCTKLEIVAPRYVEVTVTAAIQTRAGASAAKTADRVLTALRQFLDPLIGGPDGLGWPFGRAVYRTEILRVIDDVPGVDHVASMSLFADEGPAQCGDLVLCPTALVYSGAHQIEVV